MSIIVHHLENSRSQRVLWLLEELGASYDVVRYERDKKTMLAPPALKAIHPLGKSPVIEMDGVILAETGAIVETLAETLEGGDAFIPARGTAEFTQYRFWLHYAEGSAMTPLLLKLVFSRLPSQVPFLVRPLANGIATAAQKTFIDPQIASHLSFWEQRLKDHAYLAGDKISLADIMMSFPMEALTSRFSVAKDSPVRAYLNRLHARPAYQRALKVGGPYAYA